MVVLCSGWVFFFFKQKTAYEMRISDWSSDVCSSDLEENGTQRLPRPSLAPTFRSSSRVITMSVAEVIWANCGFDSNWMRRGCTGVSGSKEIGRASCRERVCQYVSISVVAVSLKKQKKNQERGKIIKQQLT